MFTLTSARPPRFRRQGIATGPRSGACRNRRPAARRIFM